MMVLTVNQRDVHIDAAEEFSSEQPAETTTDDDDSGAVALGC